MREPATFCLTPYIGSLLRTNLDGRSKRQCRYTVVLNTSTLKILTLCRTSKKSWKTQNNIRISSKFSPSKFWTIVKKGPNALPGGFCFSSGCWKSREWQDGWKSQRKLQNTLQPKQAQGIIFQLLNIFFDDGWRNLINKKLGAHCHQHQLEGGRHPHHFRWPPPRGQLHTCVPCYAEKMVQLTMRWPSSEGQDHIDRPYNGLL